MQKTYIWRPGRQMHNFHTQVLGVMSDDGILAKLHPIIRSYISEWVFSHNFLQYFENVFLEHLRTIASIIEKDSITTT